VLCLTISPLRRLGGPNLVRYRRAIGLLAFYYAILHLSVYVVFDQGLDVAAIWADIIKRPYITLGMIAFSILIPLAITSNNAMIRRLGGAAWARLHRWVYAAAVAATIHFSMVVKAWPPEPLVYLALVALLLLFRLVIYNQKQTCGRARTMSKQLRATPLRPEAVRLPLPSP
jgi:sulfoxide reductase heme-binding subunit YedZ